MSLSRYGWWDLKGEDKLRRLLVLGVAEALGTGIVQALGCAAAFPALQFPLVYIAIAFGFAISTAITGIGHISGGHINPAVTVACAILGKISPLMALIYIVSQCIGAIIGMQTLMMVLPMNISSAYCVTRLSPGIQPWNGVFIEMILTSVLVLLACSAWDPRNSAKEDSLPIRFGLGVVALAIAGAKLTGCSMNPARSLAPALLSGDFKHQWVYWVGPLSGGVLMSLLYRFLLLESSTSLKLQEDLAEIEPLTNRRKIVLETINPKDTYVKAGE